MPTAPTSQAPSSVTAISVRADLSHAKLSGADIRGCRLDGIRGTPDMMDGLMISPDQAALLITLFRVDVKMVTNPAIFEKVYSPFCAKICDVMVA